MRQRRPRRLNDALPGGTPLDLTLSDADHALIAAANEVLARHYKPFWHTVAAAIRGRTGGSGPACISAPRLAGFPSAPRRSRSAVRLLEGDGSIETAVAVRHPKPDEEDRELAVVPPCGACREMILDHWPDALVIVKEAGVLLRRPVRVLLPVPYRR